MKSTELKSKRILVTGATGFIGGALARRLQAEEAHVLALERTPGRGDVLADAGIEVVKGDITDRARMQEIVHGGVQIVMHIAAWLGGGSPRDAYRVNVEATKSLAEIAAAAGVERFVYTSSIAVYGPHGDRDVDETTPLKLYGDPYGDAKIQSEWALHEVGHRTGLPYVIVRPGMVYGPGSPGWTKRLAILALRGQIPLIDGGRGTAYPVYIDNLVDLLVLCATHPAAISQIFNAVDDGPITLRDFFGGYMRMIPTERAIRLPGWVARVILTAADPFTRRNLRYIADQLVGRGQVSNLKAKEVLGWEPHISLQEGLQRSEEWLRAQRILHD